MKFKSIKPSKKDIEFVEHRKLCREEIAKAYSYVPPVINIGMKSTGHIRGHGKE